MKPYTRKLDPEIQALLSRANVHRIGKGIKLKDGKLTGELAWVITVTQKLPEAELLAQDIIPPMFKGLPTDVRVRRIARARTANTLPRTAKWRPAPGGVSIGHYEITAGTLGVVVYKGGNPYILSNNHVLANCNKAKIGDPILQPGAYDGGTLEDEIAKLYDYIPIEFGGISGCLVARSIVFVCNKMARLFKRKTRLPCPVKEAEANLVDCALGKPNDVGDISDEILEIGRITGYIEPVLGLRIKKSGRTTGLTAGVIREVDVTVNVNMGDGRIATFTDCFASEDISDPGDSGSPAVSDDKVAGLLFAGSDQDTIYCRYDNVKKLLELD